MAKLSQVVAVEKGIKAAAQRTVTNAYHAVQSEAPLNGLTRTYEPRDSDGDKLPSEETRVQFTVADKLNDVRKALVKLFDVTATKDYGNAQATADVKIDDSVFLENVPPTLLLFLEKYLTDTRTFLSKLPVLDPSVNWTDDEASGLYKSDPVVTTRTRKEPKAHVLYAATDKHAAQVESFTVDSIIGDYTAIRFSGAITKARRDQLVERADTLLQAVKYAREEANSTVVDDHKIGETVFDFLFA